MGICNLIREKRLIYTYSDQRPASSLTTHTCIHSGPFSLSYVLLSKCVISLPSSDPLHMLSLVKLIFSIRFSFKYCFFKELSLRLLSKKSKLTLPVLFFYCTLYSTSLQFITFNIYVFNLVIDFISASQTNDVRATKAEMCLIW